MNTNAHPRVRCVGAVCIGIAFVAAHHAGVFAQLPDCSGLVQGNVDCAQTATCPTIDPLDGSGTCSGTEISVSLVDRCTSVNASNADNCTDTTTTPDCGDRKKCEKVQDSVGLWHCLGVTKLGDVHYPEPTDGGDCVVPSG